MKQDTLITRAGLRTEKYNGAINPPIYQLSTILFPTISDYAQAQKGKNIHNGYEARDCSYGTVGSATASDLSEALSLLEVENHIDQSNRCHTLLSPSGLVSLSMAAITFSKKDGHILIPDNAYGPFKRFITQDIAKWGVEVTYYSIKDDIEALVRDNTSLIMLESPGSITFEIADIDKIVKVAKANNIVTVIDNTWATPIFFKPLEYGIDVSLYAVTKYINGHSDVLMGAAHARGEVFECLYNTYKNYGVTVNSQDCYLVHRGLRTLNLRLERHQSTTMKVAEYLQTIPEVQEVLCPALPTFPQHHLWKKYFKGVTGLFSIILDKKYSQEHLGEMIDNMNLFGIGASWGGYRSLILPFDLDHYHREFNQYNTSCIRIFCGLEDPDDLIEDLEQAFGRLRKSC